MSGDIEDAGMRLPAAAPVLRAALLSWYDHHHRVLPWRRNSHSKLPAAPGGGAPLAGLSRADFAYGVFVSELMLQQTQVERVRDYFIRWMARWPTLRDLAAASEEEVNAQWAGLGYYRRARFLLQGARYAVEHTGGELPSTAQELLKIPGIGVRALEMDIAALLRALTTQAPYSLRDRRPTHVPVWPVSPLTRAARRSTATLCASSQGCTRWRKTTRRAALLLKRCSDWCESTRAHLHIISETSLAGRRAPRGAAAGRLEPERDGAWRHGVHSARTALRRVPRGGVVRSAAPHANARRGACDGLSSQAEEGGAAGGGGACACRGVA